MQMSRIRRSRGMNSCCVSICAPVLVSLPIQKIRAADLQGILCRYVRKGSALKAGCTLIASFIGCSSRCTVGRRGTQCGGGRRRATGHRRARSRCSAPAEVQGGARDACAATPLYGHRRGDACTGLCAAANCSPCLAKRQPRRRHLCGSSRRSSRPKRGGIHVQGAQPKRSHVLSPCRRPPRRCCANIEKNQTAAAPRARARKAPADGLVFADWDGSVRSPHNPDPAVCERR
jgi:hypothetical protein